MGTGTEVWNPESSTVLQVLLFLQALVLNEKPYFNEAGFDEEIRKVDDERNSIRMLSYSHANRCCTYYASHLSCLVVWMVHKGHIIFSMPARLIWMVHRLVTLTVWKGCRRRLQSLFHWIQNHACKTFPRTHIWLQPKWN
ncbi:unnamed protein product [Musa textilis]